MFGAVWKDRLHSIGYKKVNLGKLGASETVEPVLVTVMDRETDSLGRYQRFTQELRNAGIRAEMYQGNWKKFGNQLVRIGRYSGEHVGQPEVRMNVVLLAGREK